MLVYLLSDWLLKEVLLGIVKTDPSFAELALITAIYFAGIFVSRNIHLIEFLLSLILFPKVYQIFSYI